MGVNRKPERQDLVNQIYMLIKHCRPEALDMINLERSKLQQRGNTRHYHQWARNANTHKRKYWCFNWLFFNACCPLFLHNAETMHVLMHVFHCFCTLYPCPSRHYFLLQYNPLLIWYFQNSEIFLAQQNSFQF